jgi:hypothetical protein
MYIVDYEYKEMEKMLFVSTAVKIEVRYVFALARGDGIY